MHVGQKARLLGQQSIQTKSLLPVFSGTGYTILRETLILLRSWGTDALELTGENLNPHLLPDAELILDSIPCVGLVKGFYFDCLDNLVSVSIHDISLSCTST